MKDYEEPKRKYLVIVSCNIPVLITAVSSHKAQKLVEAILDGEIDIEDTDIDPEIARGLQEAPIEDWNVTQVEEK